MLRIQDAEKRNGGADDLGKVLDYQTKKKRDNRKRYLKLTLFYFFMFILGLFVEFFLESC